MSQRFRFVTTMAEPKMFDRAATMPESARIWTRGTAGRKAWPK